jgi:hypothetical protein
MYSRISARLRSTFTATSRIRTSLPSVTSSSFTMGPWSEPMNVTQPHRYSAASPMTGYGTRGSPPGSRSSPASATAIPMSAMPSWYVTATKM